MDIKLACTHENSLIHQYNHGIRCEVCAEEISGECYRCRRCEAWLHASCASKLRHLPHEIIHPLHSQHQLKLQLDFSWVFICDKCLYISTGSYYSCDSCNFSLELTCASSVNDLLPEKQWRGFKDGQKKTIQHYLHNDKLGLFKYRKVIKNDYNCSRCEKRLLDLDVCYGCIRHEFFLHEECSDKIPRTLIHPFHPSHPLRLHYISHSNYCCACEKDILTHTDWSSAYGCQICDFRLDFHCAKLSPTLKHKCHDHPLTYFGKLIRYQRKHFQCNLCSRLCDANFYRCVQCNFNLHLKCVSIPSSAKHKYHRHQLILMDPVKEDDSEEYYCDACENERNPNLPVYYCGKCTYIVHIECILHEDNISSEEVPSSAAPTMDSKALIVKEMEHTEGTDDIHTSQQPLFQPLIHQHPMKFYEVVEKVNENRYCYGCRFIVSGPSYICTECKGYVLHERCANLPYEIQHPFHSTHPLYLYASLSGLYGILSYTVCDECRDIAMGFIYICEECNFKLDVKCALTVTGVSQLKEMERVTELHHFTHPHQLILGKSSDRIYQIKCTICELSILGPAYLCHNPSPTPNTFCLHIVHESCLRLPQKMQVPFHLEHMLVLGFWDPYDKVSRCYACQLGCDSFRTGGAYSCEQCQIKLHAMCAYSLRRPLKYESHSHMHNLYYFGPHCQLLFASEYKNGIFPCSKCQGNCTGRPFYRCLESDINFHLECVPVPQIVKSRCHIHPLVLKDSFVEDASGKYYCDVCEEERCEDAQVYCCEECNNLFVADIECALAKVENVLFYLDPPGRIESPSGSKGLEEEELTASKELEEESKELEEEKSTTSEELKEEKSTASEELEEEESKEFEEEESTTSEELEEVQAERCLESHDHDL